MPKTFLMSVLLPDAPATTDRFSGHSAVAGALRDTVAGEGSGVLAVVGPFGSGKSTVVHLMQEQVDPAEIAVVVFDAWAHRGASLHRALLVALVAHLDPAGTLAPETSGAVGPVQTEATTTTRPGPWGVWAGVSLALVPLLVVFVSPLAANYEVVVEEGRPLIRSVDGNPTAAAVLFTFVVAWGWLMAWAASLPAPRVAPDEEPQDEPAPDEAAREKPSLQALFTQTVTTTQTVHGRELSSDDFERHVRALATEWLARGASRRVVLVLDDLDRLEARDLEGARLALRSLYRLCGGTNRIAGLWTLVPTRDVPEEDREGYEWSDKLYLARFMVPPALPNATADYLEGLLREAFPDHATGQPGTLAQAAQVWLWSTRDRLGERALPPRRALRFVNDLVALYRQHGDAPVSLVAQAAFLALDEPLEIEGVERRRLELAVGVDDWFPLAAALTYSLPPDRAVEAFLRSRVEAAFATGDQRAVQDAFAGHPAATLRLAARAVHLAATGGTPHIVDNAAFAPAGLPDAPLVRTAWNALVRDVDTITGWHTVMQDGAAGRGAGALLARIAAAAPARLPSFYLSLNVVLHPVASRSGGATKPPMDNAIEAWASTTPRILEAALHGCARPDALAGYAVPGAPETYLKAVRAASGSPDRVMQLLKPRAAPADVLRPLELDDWGEAFSGAVLGLLRVGADWDWTPVIDAAAQRISSVVASSPTSSSAGMSIAAINEVVRALLRLAHDRRSTARPQAEAALQALGRSGALLKIAELVDRNLKSSGPSVSAEGPLHHAISLSILLHGPAAQAASPSLTRDALGGLAVELGAGGALARRRTHLSRI